VHGDEADVHHFWLLMLHGEEDSHDDCLELGPGELEEASSAVLDDLLNESEEVLSELREGHIVILDHAQGSVAEINKHVGQEALEQLSHFLEHGGKEHEHLGVSGMGVVVLVVINQSLEGGKELFVEDRVFSRLFNESLDESQDVLPQSLHWLQHVRVLLGLNRIRDALRVESIDPEQVVEDVPQVDKVHMAHTFSYSLVDLDDEVKLFDHFWSH
jgi:hypothetical protein